MELSSDWKSLFPISSVFKPPLLLTSWIAQRMVDASGLRGEHVGVDLEIGLFFLNKKII